MDGIIELIKQFNSFVSGPVLLPLLAGTGLFLTVGYRFMVQRRILYGFRMMWRGRRKEGTAGDISPFNALMTAMSATVGTGNIAGVATAIFCGGPGALFWMWLIALAGMATKFSEAVLAVHFREQDEHGNYIGGPMYYIKNGLGPEWKWLASLYALFGVLTVFGTGTATQVNTIVSSINTALESFHLINADQASIMKLMVGIIIAILVAVVLLGGIQRIGQVAEKLVPFMALLYILLALGIIAINWRRVPEVFAMIFQGAFTPRAATGGIIGSMFLSLKKGVSRGIFSNEAGLGTGSIAHACSDTDDAVQQGYFGIFEVFMDTIVICTMTALVILCSGVNVAYGEAAGAELTISGFTSTYGSWVSVFTAVSMCCFAFSTIIGWGLYGSRCVEFIFTSKAVKPFLVAYSLVSIVGATIDLGLLWDIAETFNGLMAIPNLIALFLLSGVVVKLAKGEQVPSRLS